jgi:hypothetical protein
MILNNLVKNSIAAYFSAIEIHNKPKIAYRYETVTLLMTNAWELILKAYIYKYIGRSKIYDKRNNGNTIQLSEAIRLTEASIDAKTPGYFKPIAANIRMIEKYRNDVAHFYCEELEPYIFMIVAKSTLNFVDFLKRFFNKDILEEEGLYILPVGFKLPFNPEDFFSKKSTNSMLDFEAVRYVNDIIEVITTLKSEGIDESIVVGFDIYMEKVKQIKNGDLLVSITSEDEADVNVANVKKIQIVNDKGAQKMQLSDEEIFRRFPFSYDALVKRCKEEIDGFKQGRAFNEIMKQVKNDPVCSYERFLKPGGGTTTFIYNEDALKKIKSLFSKLTD